MINEKEKIIFNNLIKQNPKIGKKYKENEYLIRKGKGEILYKIFSWMTNDNKEYYISSKNSKKFFEYDLTPQLYYDIVILGLKNIEDRPKCECGKYTKFLSIINGYRKYCDRSCMYKYRITSEEFKTCRTGGNRIGHPVSEETKRKISATEKGKISPPITKETRAKLSKIMKGRKITWKDKQSISALKRIEKNPEAALKFVKSRGKSGYYKPIKSEKEIRYLSTWELKFMKMCDLSKDILMIDTVESIPYVLSGKDHMYIPDFKLKLDIGLTVIIEIKPKNLINDPVVIAKRITAKKYCKKMGYKYITLTEIELFKRIKGSFNIYDYVV